VPVTPEGERAGEPFLYVNGIDARFRPEPEPHWVAYMAERNGWHAYLQTFPKTSSDIQVSVGPGYYPEWGPDGKEIFYVARDLKLMRVAVTVNGDRAEVSAPEPLFPLPISDITRSPYEVSRDGSKFLVRVDIEPPSPMNVIVNWTELMK
jgi:hypothetical protein